MSISAFAQALTGELLVKSGVRQGMTVVNVGALTGDTAFLIAERVGESGKVVAVESDPSCVAIARERASNQCFRNVAFECVDLEDLQIEMPADAVVGRFYLANARDPSAALSRAASLVRAGGAIVFQEWDYRSLRTTHSRLPLYSGFIESAINALEQRGVRLDMGLNLIDTFVEAGLPVPSIRTELSPVTGEATSGYALLETLLGTDGIANITEELHAEADAARVHTYFPLQVGAWTRL